ncbi:MAG: hypothetical protein GX370_10145 [Clostridia bacterium]|nr:hypothetical protein [Clostridia bacterium]
MKRHNFIMKEYEKDLSKRENKRFIYTVLILFTINLIGLSFLNYKKNKLSNRTSKAVFKVREEERIKEKEEHTYIFDLREKFERCLDKSVKVKAFFWEEGNIRTQIIAVDESHCIDFINKLEESEVFQIIGLSTIDSTEEGYKLSLDIATKEDKDSR